MTSKKHTRSLMRAIAAIGLTAVFTPAAFAVAYTVVPSGSTQDWNTAGTWTSPGGTTPGAAAGDTATVSANFGGVNQTVNISVTPVNGIAALTLGDTVASPTTPGSTVISASTGASLFGAAAGLTVTSNGSAGAVNTISAPVSLAGGLNFAIGTNPVTVSGKITPTAAAARTIDNSSATTVNLGAIDISTGGTAATLTIRNGNNVGGANNVTNLNDVIADGSSVASALTIGSRLSGGTIQINADNTYTGNTVIGVQGNQNTVVKINSNLPFGSASTGSFVTSSPAGSTTTFEAIGGDRTITKNTTSIQRSTAFQGVNSFTLAGTNVEFRNTPVITNNITTAGKTVTIGQSNGSIVLNNNNTDFFRMREFNGAGTTIIASNISENSGAAPTAQSKMVVKNSGTGTLVLAGTNTYQGGTRITSTGTVQVGNGGTSGTLDSGNSLVPVVNSTAAGTLAFNRSDAVSSAVVANGPLNLTQKGGGALTLSNSQYHTGNNTIGDGVSASTLVVNGGVVAGSSTTANANIVTTAAGTLSYRTVTLTGADTVANLNVKVGQPVYVTGSGASAASYVDAILSPTSFSVWGETLLNAAPSALTFGGGSGLGSGTTTINNLGTLAGSGALSGPVNALAGSTIAPGATAGTAGTLSTGALSLTSAKLAFDLSSSAASGNDLIAVLGGGSVTFTDLTFSFTATNPGLFELGNAYDLISTTGGFTGDVNSIATILGGTEAGIYTPSYAVNNRAGTNFLVVTFNAIPEPSTYAIGAGVLALGAALLRRRKQS